MMKIKSEVIYMAKKLIIILRKLKHIPPILNGKLIKL
jgi:hypothetical protein